jgi:hypothetical protein
MTNDGFAAAWRAGRRGFAGVQWATDETPAHLETYQVGNGPWEIAIVWMAPHGPGFRLPEPFEVIGWGYVDQDSAELAAAFLGLELGLRLLSVGVCPACLERVACALCGHAVHDGSRGSCSLCPAHPAAIDHVTAHRQDQCERWRNIVKLRERHTQ